MNLLLANDDGIQARGLKELAAALSEQGTVYIAAPDGQRSASGHSITVSRPVRLTEVPYEGAAGALAISGTPADCVKLGIRYFAAKNIPIDVVFSGINHGGNLGTDTLYSGTVSAAIEGALCGKPSVAVSVNSHQPVYFGGACRLAVQMLQVLKERDLGVTTLNLNVPDLPEEQIKGVRYTRLGMREYDEWFSQEETASGETQYRYGGSTKIGRASCRERV